MKIFYSFTIFLCLISYIISPVPAKKLCPELPDVHNISCAEGTVCCRCDKNKPGCSRGVFCAEKEYKNAQDNAHFCCSSGKKACLLNTQKCEKGRNNNNEEIDICVGFSSAFLDVEDMNVDY